MELAKWDNSPAKLQFVPNRRIKFGARFAPSLAEKQKPGLFRFSSNGIHERSVAPPRRNS
jgi:hypothetical protein